MHKNKSIKRPLLEGLCFTVFGSIIAIFAFTVGEFYSIINNNAGGFVVHGAQNIVGLGWLLIGLSLPAVAVNLIFGNAPNLFVKWLLIAVIASISATSLQAIFLIYQYDLVFQDLFRSSIPYFDFMPTVFAVLRILVPFSFLFAAGIFLINRKEKFT